MRFGRFLLMGALLAGAFAGFSSGVASLAYHAGAGADGAAGWHHCHDSRVPKAE